MFEQFTLEGTPYRFNRKNKLFEYISFKQSLPIIIDLVEKDFGKDVLIIHSELTNNRIGIIIYGVLKDYYIELTSNDNLKELDDYEKFKNREKKLKRILK